MLIPLRPGELQRLVPAVASGPQFNACSGNPRKLLQRVLIAVIGGVISLLISQSMPISGQAHSVMLVVGFVFFLYLLWGPILEAGQRNASLRGYPAAAVFDGVVDHIYSREVVEAQREQANRDGRLELIENRRQWLCLELADEDGYLGQIKFPLQKKHQNIKRGMVIRTLVLSNRKDFAKVSALTDAWLPQIKLWVGEYPYLLHPAFEEICLRRLRD